MKQTDEDRKRSRAAAKAMSTDMKMAQRRPTESTETAVTCPKCRAQPGERCTYEFNGRVAISVWPHVERKRLHHRERLIAKVSDVLLERGIGQVHVAQEIARAIMDEIQGPLETVG